MFSEPLKIFNNFNCDLLIIQMTCIWENKLKTLFSNIIEIDNKVFI